MDHIGLEIWGWRSAMKKLLQSARDHPAAMQQDPNGKTWQNYLCFRIFISASLPHPASKMSHTFFFPGSIAIFTDMTCAFHRPAWQRRNAESLIGSRVIHRSTIQGQTEATAGTTTVDTTTTVGTTTTGGTTTSGGATNGARQAPRPGVVAQLNQQGKHGKAMKLMFF